METLGDFTNNSVNLPLSLDNQTEFFSQIVRNYHSISSFAMTLNIS